MIRLFSALCLVFGFDLHAKAIEIDVKDGINYGCTYHNDDLDSLLSKGEVDASRIIYDESLMHVVTENEIGLYKYILNRAKVYHFSRATFEDNPSYLLENVFFEYEGSRLTFYRSLSSSKSKGIGFCYEGRFDSNLVEMFMSKDKIKKLNVTGDGDFYLVDDAGFITAKLVVIKGDIKEMYLYMTYD